MRARCGRHLRLIPSCASETPPGLQAQVDFAEFRLPWGKRFALLAVLGYSRLLWLQFYPRQTLAVLMRGLEEAFAAFGGVPAELLFDQMKAVIIDDQREVAWQAAGERGVPALCRALAIFGSERAVRIGRAPKARSSVRSATCVRASSTAASSSTTRI